MEIFAHLKSWVADAIHNFKWANCFDILLIEEIFRLLNVVFKAVINGITTLIIIIVIALKGLTLCGVT